MKPFGHRRRPFNAGSSLTFSSLLKYPPLKTRCYSNGYRDDWDRADCPDLRQQRHPDGGSSVCGAASRTAASGRSVNEDRSPPRPVPPRC